MKGLCWVISGNIYSELGVSEELGGISCSDGPDFSRIGINVTCMIQLSYSEKYMQRGKKGLGHDLHHVIFFWKTSPSHKGLQQDLNNPENQEAATFPLWHGANTQAGLVESSAGNKDRGSSRLLEDAPVEIIKTMFS